jgi:hypothetical protein
MKLNDQPSLRRKLVVVIMLSVGMALSLALAAFLVLEIRSYRASTHQELNVLAEVMGDSTAFAVASKDRREAERLLAKLHVQTRIVEAVIVDQTGQPFASYRRDGLEGPPLAVRNSEGSALILARPILQAGERIGTLHLRADLRELGNQVGWMLTGSLLVTLLIGFTTLLFAKRMSGVITEPILHLAEAARRIATRQSIGECEIRETRDEVGIPFGGIPAAGASGRLDL